MMITHKILSHTGLQYRFKIMYEFSANKRKIDASKNYYQTLNIRFNATLPQIKKGYFQMTKKYHPDYNKGNQTKFNQIKQAYDILSNQQLRKQYDSIKHKQTKQSKNQQQRQQNTGPYQTEQEYYKNTSKPYYNNTTAEWQKIRLGYRSQSYVDMYSQLTIDKGAGTDEELTFFQRKKNVIKQWSPDNKQLDAQFVEQRKALLEKQHEERLKKLQQQMNRKYNQSKMKQQSLFSKFLNLFSSSSKIKQKQINEK